MKNNPFKTLLNVPAVGWLLLIASVLMFVFYSCKFTIILMVISVLNFVVLLLDSQKSIQDSEEIFERLTHKDDKKEK